MDFTNIFCVLLFLQLCLSPAVNAQLNVQIFPSKAEKEINIGDSLTLSCEATGVSGQKVIKWMHNGQEVTETALTARVHTQTNGQYQQLKLMRIVENDAGMYKCIGAAGGMNAEDTIKLIVLIKLEVTSPTEQFGILGDTKVVKCEHKGKPPPTVTWKFSNLSQITSSERYSIMATGLQISNLKKSDERIYICELMTLSTGNTYLHEVDFDVVIPPKINEMLSIEPPNAVVGSEVRVTCNSEGDPAPSYQFQRGEGRTLVENGVQGNILTIPSVTVNDQAKYTCVATNKGGKDERVTTLDVLVKPTIELPRGEVYSVVAGEFLEVPCIVRGDPQPSIVWDKAIATTSDGKVIDGWSMVENSITGDDKDVKTVTTSLNIPKVDYKHNGDYACEGTSSIGFIQKTISVEVQYKPNFDTELNRANTDFWGWEGHTTVLQCQSNANPAVAEIRWKMQGADGNQVSVPLGAGTYQIASFEVEKHMSTSKLSVKIEADSSLYTDYFCEAVNKHNTGSPVSHTVTLKAAKTPGRPTVRQGEILSMSTVVLATEPSNTGGQPVKQFEYEAMMDGSSRGTRETVDSQGPGMDTSIQIRNLTPGTTYRVKVRAINNVGGGSWTDMRFVTVTESKPERMVFSSVPVADANSYNLQWKDIATGGSELSQVEIRWVEVTLKTDGKSVQKVVGEWKDAVIPANQLNQKAFTITGLKPGTDYQIRAKATNGIGPSDEQSLLIKTAPGALGSRTNAASFIVGNTATFLISLACLALL